MRKMRVYTGGYMHGAGSDRFPWRDQLVKDCRDVPISWLHPGVFPGDIPGKGNNKIYAARDELLIQKCDVLFAYLDITVARNLGVASEIGYAWALGKIVIVVNANKETVDCGSLDLCRAWCHAEWNSWKLPIDHLKFLAAGFKG